MILTVVNRVSGFVCSPGIPCISDNINVAKLGILGNNDVMLLLRRLLSAQ